MPSEAAKRAAKAICDWLRTWHESPQMEDQFAEIIDEEIHKNDEQSVMFRPMTQEECDVLNQKKEPLPVTNLDPSPVGQP